MSRVRVLLFAPILLAGCTVGPDYHPKAAAELGVPDAYSVTPATTPEDLTRWWQKFDDPVLGQLVEQAAAANLDIAQSVARLRQARESLNQSRASLLPTLSGSAGYQRNASRWHRRRYRRGRHQ
jgi:multidrug efflux system outer membrane protein